ncbi:12546_t:CDS:1, partial [Ambispora gerdemannii]
QSFINTARADYTLESDWLTYSDEYLKMENTVHVRNTVQQLLVVLIQKCYH